MTDAVPDGFLWGVNLTLDALARESDTFLMVATDALAEIVDRDRRPWRR